MTEYGRNIQQMVSFALTIEDREERTRCVKTVINIMGNMFPYLRDVNDFKHKLWDHVAIMSDFKLDIDFPYEIVQAENLYTTVEQMIDKVSEYPEGEEKNELIRLIANQMKKCFLTWNKEVVDDKKIFDDLRQLSKGKLDISEDFLKLVESRDVLHNKKNKAKKK